MRLGLLVSGLEFRFESTRGRKRQTRVTFEQDLMVFTAHRRLHLHDCIFFHLGRIQANKDLLGTMGVAASALKSKPIKKEETKMLSKVIGITAGVFLTAGVASSNGEMATKFTLRVENITKPDAFTASNGVKWSLAFSPGTAVVHTENAPIFTEGKKDRGKGLEAQSEDGNPGTLAKSLKGAKGIKSVVVYNTPVGAKGPGPITPGAAYETTISAAPGNAGRADRGCAGTRRVRQAG